MSADDLRRVGSRRTVAVADLDDDPRLAGKVLLALGLPGAVVFCGLMGWDTTWDGAHDTDALTSLFSGPYQRWQVLTALALLALTTACATWRADLTISAIPPAVGFTTAWSAGALLSGAGPYWPVGAVAVLLSTSCWLVVVACAAFVARWSVVAVARRAR